ncbi:hypothetical protein GCM10025857_25240 [Alicyclobacillus contaminans]|uniref:heme o synthase n=1 Tax=Alicyclobacillus contaminans TaxID=392016 RepID=UPI00041B51BB|nr:heme o synthase [Alicyclobacillus contaminans]GMA51167.1 hypothetical protein GCM10025857_25240 [Alicyclobacillus contaminans]
MSMISGDVHAIPNQADSVRSVWKTVQAYVALTKPKILVMLLITGYCAMVVANRGVPSAFLTAATLVGLALSSAAGAVLNMWYDRDIDGLMRRTSSRPLPTGAVKPGHALVFGIGLEAASFALLYGLVNPLTALLSFLGFVYYVLIYTIWLKRRTPQNIVIGGGAGAIPPLVGWAAVAGHLSWLAWLMFAVIFLWTPPHFWALALYKNEDYVRAGVPMMPVVRGFRSTKRQMFAYSVVLLTATLIPSFTGTATLVYTVPTVVLGGLFSMLAWRCLREPDTSMIWAKRLFLSSLLYLPVWFLAIVLGVRGML